MVTATSRLGLKLQDTGSNLNLWGQILNTDVITLVDEASGTTIVTVASAADVVLSNTIYLTNQARRSVIQANGTPGATFNIIVPTFDKSWFVHNRTAFDLTVKMSAGAGAVVRAGRSSTVYSDGTDCFTNDPTLDQIKAPAANLSLNSKKITDVLAGTTGQDAINYTQLQAVYAYAAGIANSGILAPGTVAGQFLKWDGTAWAQSAIPPIVAGNGTTVAGSFTGGDMAVNVDAGTTANKVVKRDANARIANLVGLWTTKTTTYTAVNGDQLLADTSGGAFTITLPATPAKDDQVVIARIGASNLTIARNGSTISGSAEDHVLDTNYALATALCTASLTWRIIPGMLK